MCTTADHGQRHTPPPALAAAQDDDGVFIDDGDDDEPTGATTHPAAPATNADEDVDMGAPPAMAAPVLTKATAASTTDASPTGLGAEEAGAVAPPPPPPGRSSRPARDGATGSQ